MSANKLILAATDWSENARRAVQRAAYISEQRGAQGLLMHVTNQGVCSGVIHSAKSNLARKNFSRIDRLADSIRQQTGFQFATQIHAGNVASSIAKQARRSGAQLVTLGRWTDSAFIRWSYTPFEKSIALRLLNQNVSPVLIVKTDPKSPYRRMLVAIDESEHAATCIQQAHDLAPGAELIVVFSMDHSWESRVNFSNVFESELRELRVRHHEATLDRINALLEKCSVPAHQVVKIVEYGYASKLILEKEQEFNVDLLVIGRSAKSRFNRLFFGGVTSQVVARARCDVLVVPSKAKRFF